MRTGILFLLLFGLITLSSECDAGQWLFYHDKEIRGRVVEADTGKPIEGALVIGLWELIDVVGEGPGGYANVEVTVSDHDGNFIIPAWMGFKPWKLVYMTTKNAPFIVIFKPGFKIHHTNSPMRKGFPDNRTMTPEEQQIDKLRYGINPARLIDIQNDEERLKNIRDFRGMADFPGWHYTRKEIRAILSVLREEIINLPNSMQEKIELLNGIYQYKLFYLGENQ